MEVEKKAEVAMEMSDLVVYCQPRSKEKDRFGKHMHVLILHTKTFFTPTQWKKTQTAVADGMWARSSLSIMG